MPPAPINLQPVCLSIRSPKNPQPCSPAPPPLRITMLDAVRTYLITYVHTTLRMYVRTYAGTWVGHADSVEAEGYAHGVV